MKKYQIYILILSLMILFGCTLFSNKPTDSQITMDVKNELSQYNKYFDVQDVNIKGIIFIKHKKYIDNIAIAEVLVKIHMKKDYEYSVWNRVSGKNDVHIPYLSGGEKMGQVITISISKEYIKSDRGWMLER